MRGWILRFGPVSLVVRPRALLVGVGALLILMLAVLAHLMFAGRPLAFGEVLKGLSGGPGTSARLILQVQDFRLPRTVAGAVAGACLALSGALTQNVARNPLATPEILGVTAGASLGAVAVLVIAGGGAGGLSGAAAAVGLPLSAGLGALLFGGGVFLLALKRGSDVLDSNRMVLVGLGATAVATSMVTWLLTLGDVTNAGQALTWMSGSLNGKDWGTVSPITVVALPLLVIAAFVARWLLLGSFDDNTARSLGLPLRWTRPLLLLLAVLLAAVGTVLAGPVAFVALVCPLAARQLTGTVVPPLGVTALLGACFVVVADLVAGFVLPHALPVGVLTTVLGAPVLIALVLRTQRRTS
ncbi:FecCD family ABC transporter permease [Arthrobacter woluwensis]|uniref:FecCD family ABC transporter permease n=1 Tax=Arthrobacter woluwensis TaxID=156980 RepID=UPI001FBA37F6|nr:iron ABC transporter permease [Arthrobacter woluwensis]